jgi:tRNA modification GTPase
MGIQRTLDTVAQADIILYVHDATQPVSRATDDLQQLPLNGKHLILIYNKTDLPDAASPEQEGSIALSAKTGTGLDVLSQSLASIIRNDMDKAPDILLTNARHYEALGLVDQALQHVTEGLTEELPADLVVIDLRDALHHLGTITGQVTTDEVLGTIFSRFCVGK